MVRVKRGVSALKKRRTILKAAKGYRLQRSVKEKAARDALLHAGLHSFRDRRLKKRTMRSEWIVQINAAVREAGIPSYSKFIKTLKDKGVAVDRKVLSALAREHAPVFARFLEEVR